MEKLEKILFCIVACVLWMNEDCLLEEIIAITMTVYVVVKVIGLRVTVAFATDKKKDKEEK